MPSSACDWSSDVCSSDRSEEHTSELQSRSDLVCRILRAEEHTSELQSRSDLVCRLLLEKKKLISTQDAHDVPNIQTHLGVAACIRVVDAAIPHGDCHVHT